MRTIIILLVAATLSGCAGNPNWEMIGTSILMGMGAAERSARETELMRPRVCRGEVRNGNVYAICS
jgi:hypothetical protein